MLTQRCSELQALFRSLNERLSPTQRQSTLENAKELLRQSLLQPSPRHGDRRWQIDLSLDVLDQGTNDSRRSVLQCLAEWMLEHGEELILVEQQALLQAFLRCADRCVRKSQCRTAASAIKATHALLAAFRPSASEVNAVMDTLMSTMYIGIEPSLPPPANRIGASKPIPARHAGLQFGALSFQSASTSRSSSAIKGLRSKSSSSSLASSAAASDGGSVYGTETSTIGRYSGTEEDEVEARQGTEPASKSRSDANQEQRKRDSANKGVRQNSVHCLLTLAKQQPRELYSFWGSLFPDDGQPSSSRLSSQTTRRRRPSLMTLILDDPAPSIKLAAIDALNALLQGGQAHLSMAQQRPDKLAAFTSLSAKLGTMVVDLRSHLIVLLQSVESTAMLIALLRLTRTFAVSTSRAKLLVSNASILQPVVLSFSFHKDPEVSSLAYDAITALVVHSDGSPTGSQSSNAETVPVLAAKLIEDGTADPATLQVWRTLSTCIGSTSIDQIEPSLLDKLITLCDRIFHSEVQEERLVVAELVASLLAAAAASDLPCERVVGLFDQLCNDSSSPIRKIAANALPQWVMLKDRRNADYSHCVLVLRLLVKDQDDQVRAEAVRAVGVIVSASEGLFRQHLFDKPDIPRALVLPALRDASPQVRIRAAWALANWTEALIGSKPEAGLWLAIARATLDAGNDDAGVIRARGCICKIWSPTEEDTLEVLLSLIHTLCSALDGRTSKNPKLRWNAANALARALTNPALLSSIPSLTLSQTLKSVCAGLDTKIFKVKMASAEALLSLKDAALSEADGSLVAAAISAANDVLEHEIESASFKEASLYAQDCRKIVAKLVTTFI